LLIEVAGNGRCLCQQVDPATDNDDGCIEGGWPHPGIDGEHLRRRQRIGHGHLLETAQLEGDHVHAWRQERNDVVAVPRRLRRTSALQTRRRRRHGDAGQDTAVDILDVTRNGAAGRLGRGDAGDSEAQDHLQRRFHELHTASSVPLLSHTFARPDSGDAVRTGV
jgi:hypothetical protein